jgi:hypothetical protein
MKQSVVIEKEWIDSIKDFPDDVRLSFYEYIFNYVFSEKPKITQENPNNPMGFIDNSNNPKNPVGFLAFNMIKNSLDNYISKYQAVVERNRLNGSKGGRPKKTQENPNNPMGFEEKEKVIQKEKDINNNINISSSLHSEDYSIADATEDVLTAKELNDFVFYWNSKLPLLKISKFTEVRKQKLRVRLKEVTDSTPTDTLRLLVDNVANSSFLQGDNNRGFKGTIDWVIKNESNFTKVLEGRYNDTTKETATTSKPSTSYDSRESREAEHARLRERIQARLLGGMGATPV